MLGLLYLFIGVFLQQIYAIDVQISSIFVEYGENLGSRIPTNLNNHFQSVPSISKHILQSKNIHGQLESIISNTHTKDHCAILSLGNTTLVQNYIDDDRWVHLPREGYFLDVLDY